MALRINNSRIEGIANLQFSFLRISPSYELANQILNKSQDVDIEVLFEKVTDLYKPKNGSELSNSEKVEVVTDFLKVLELRGKFGDLTTVTFNDWWKRIGGWYYGYEHDEAKVELISVFEKDQSSFDKQELLQKLTYHISHRGKKEIRGKSQSSLSFNSTRN